MYPILIICTDYTTVCYIQNQRYMQKKSFLPYNWMNIGSMAARIGITDYNNQIRILHICDNEVNVRVDLSNFPDRVEHLHSEIINVVNRVSNDVVRNEEIVVSDISKKIRKINRSKRKSRNYNHFQFAINIK